MVKQKADYILFFLVISLSLLGILFLATASAALGQARFGDAYFYVKRQILYGLIPGIVLLLTLSKIPYSKVRSMSYIGYFGTILLLLLVFLPGIGSSHNTVASSWISLGPVSFQPSEIAKLSLIIFISQYLARKKGDITNLTDSFIPILVMGMIPITLVFLQPDVGTVAILFSIFFALLFLAKSKLKHLLTLGLIGIIAFVSMIIAAPYRAARLTVFLHPELDPQGIGYQTSQSLLAIGSGGVFGLGFGRSRQKFQYLPEVHSDSIFAIISEELGFFVVSAVLILFLLLIFRLMKLSRNAPDVFSAYLILGVAMWITTQTILNVGAIIGLLPLTGVPLPFISHGGTSLAIILASFGMILNISKYAKK